MSPILLNHYSNCIGVFPYHNIILDYIMVYCHLIVLYNHNSFLLVEDLFTYVIFLLLRLPSIIAILVNIVHFPIPIYHSYYHQWAINAHQKYLLYILLKLGHMLLKGFQFFYLVILIIHLHYWCQIMLNSFYQYCQYIYQSPRNIILILILIL